MLEPSASALALVHEGWDHLKHARPLAAWASWRRALRVEPEREAATHALHVLANAGDLPEAARTESKFLPPAGEARRAEWDAAFRGRDLEDLAVAAQAFGELADDHARYNQGLCLAWLGRNAQAIDAFDRAVPGLAGVDFEVAVRAWTLCEVLRQGGGGSALDPSVWSHPGPIASAIIASRTRAIERRPIMDDPTFDGWRTSTKGRSLAESPASYRIGSRRRKS